jgi:hypothetical protein
MSPPPQIPPGTDLWQVPAGQNPDGSPSNLIDPPSNENIGVVTLSIFMTIATIFVALRLYLHLIVKGVKPWWDDLALVLSLPPQIAFTGITIWMLQMGYGARHIWDTPLAVPLLKLPYWTTVVAALPQATTGMVKLSLLLLYLRIFRPNPLLNYAIWFGIVVDVCMYTVWTFVFIFQGVLSSRVGSHLSWAQAAFNVASDIYIFILPIYGVLTLHVSSKRRLGIMAVFSTGLAAIVMSCITLAWRVQYDGSNPDPTWDATLRMTLTTLEIDVGIMCACMPLFVPLFQEGIFANWATYIRSMGSRLLRTNPPTSGASGGGVSENPNANFSESHLVHKGGPYMELGQIVPGSQSRSIQKKEWFDKTNTAFNDTVASKTGD